MNNTEGRAITYTKDDVARVLQRLRDLPHDEGQAMLRWAFNRRAVRTRDPEICRLVNHVAANIRGLGELGAAELLAKLSWFLDTECPGAMEEYFLQEESCE